MLFCEKFCSDRNLIKYKDDDDWPLDPHFAVYFEIHYLWHQWRGTKTFFCFFLLMTHSARLENDESVFFCSHKNVDFRWLLCQL